MKRLIAVSSVAVLAALTFVSPATANTCGATVVEVPGTAYVAVDDPTLASVWVYQESNGEAGLQRDDSICPSDGGGGDTVIL